MTMGEKLALLRRRNGITQEALAEALGVSRQSVSRWEMDAAFPETEKLIRLCKLFGCSLDYLLVEGDAERSAQNEAPSAAEACRFMRDCGYFFLATTAGEQPKLRPFGRIFAREGMLFFVTDRRKSVCAELLQNPLAELGSYNLRTRRWIRLTGRAVLDDTTAAREMAYTAFPSLAQGYGAGEDAYMAIFRFTADKIEIR